MIAILLEIGSDRCEFELERGERLLDRVDEVGAPLPLSCRSASCAICRVRIALGAEQFDAPSEDERATLALFEAARDERLGCQLRATSTASGSAHLVTSVDAEDTGLA
jgi:ferredoxin